MKRVAIVGAAGFGREVMPVARETLARDHAGEAVELVFVDERLAGTTVNGYPVLTSEAFLGGGGEQYFNVAIADQAIRERVAGRFLAAGARALSLRAAMSVVLDANEIGEGAILCPFTTITSNARIGRFFHANLYSYVAHDCVIGDFVTFAPAVKCNGAVVIEDYAYIGTGAVLRQGTADRPLVIGRGAVVGMGAVVTKSVPAGATVVGNPAAPMVKRGG